MWENNSTLTPLARLSRYFWELLRSSGQRIKMHPILSTFLIFALFTLFFGLLPDYYTLKARIPPFDELERSEGVLEFSWGHKTGWHTYLRTTKGRIAFTCALPNESDMTCIMGKDIDGKSRTGRRAVIWWYELSDYPGSTVPFVLQIEMDGKRTFRTYESAQRELQSRQVDAWGSTRILFVLFSIQLCVMFVWKKWKGSKGL